MNKIRELRLERGLSQAKLAARAELDPSTVNQIERGSRDASPLTLRKIAHALDVSLAELLEETASPKAPRRSPSELTFNDVLGAERRLRYLRGWRAFVGNLFAQWSQEQPTSAEIRPLVVAMNALLDEGVFDTSGVSDQAELDNISVFKTLLRKLNEIADHVEEDETAQQRRELLEAIPGGLSA